MFSVKEDIIARMKQRTLHFFLVFGCVSVLVGGVSLIFFRGTDEIRPGNMEKSIPDEELIIDEEVETPPLSTDPDQDMEAAYPDTYEIPFVVQAPRGEWKNPLFQNGCEEASVLIAARSGQREPISDAEAEKEILALSGLSAKLFGTSVDTSAKDTLGLFRAYTGRGDGILLDQVTGETLRAALDRDEILIVPVDGRSLKNPHFTVPGPETHMLVIFDYDEETNEYITHDPGTRFGASYRYAKDRLENAIRDYPTGDHLPRTSIEKRAIAIQR